jgi:acyl CoA:acetate/3-ketoacid CoA transferase beta subunit
MDALVGKTILITSANRAVKPALHFRTARLGSHSIRSERQVVAVIALTVDRPEIGDLAIGGDAETAKRVPGMAGAMACYFISLVEKQTN